MRWMPFSLFGLAVLLNLPYLTAGFSADDFLLLDQLREDPLPFSRWRGVWSTWDLPAFSNLWWRDPDATGAFFRPLPSAVLEGSVWLFGEVAWPLHLLSLVLHGLVAVTVFSLVRRLAGEARLGFLAALVWVACEDHSMGVGWIATITDVMCVLLLNVALLTYLAWVTRRRVSTLAVSLASLLLALASKETAAIGPLVMVATALILPDARDGELDRGFWGDLLRRLRTDPAAWAPAMLVFVGFITVYKAFGLGGMQNLMYLDPIGQPLDYLRNAALHLPILVLGSVSPVPPSLSMFEPSLVPLLAAAGWATLLAFGWILWPLRRRRLVVWAAGLYVLALLPQVGTEASERALYYPYVFASVLLALQLERIAPMARRLRPAAPPAPLRVRLAGWNVALGVLLPGLLLSAAMPWSYREAFARPSRDAEALEAIVRQEAPEHLLLLNTSGPFFTYYPGGILEFRLGRRLDVRVLSSCAARVAVERLGPSSFRLTADRPGWIGNLFARVVRTQPALSVGASYRNDLFTATLERLTEDGTDVLAVRFDTARPLSDPRLRWVAWDGAVFRVFPLDALPLDTPTPLADTSDPWAAML